MITVKENLALTAAARASGHVAGSEPQCAIDGGTDTGWESPSDEPNPGWFELEWKKPVVIGEIAVHQPRLGIKAADVEVWEEGGSAWRRVRRLAKGERFLPFSFLVSMNPVSAKKVRLANLRGTVRITSVEVSEHVSPPEIFVASDVDGRLVGIITDRCGTSGFPHVTVTLEGDSRGGKWREETETDGNGMFWAALPLGVVGKISLAAAASEWGFQETEVHHDIDSAHLQCGLTPLDFRMGPTGNSTETARRIFGKQPTGTVIELGGEWLFSCDPPDGFWQTGFDDSGWSPIKVPAHFEMEGFRCFSGIGGYRKWFSAGARETAGCTRLKLRFEGVYSGAEVWVNGGKAACHEGGALPFETDITELVRDGRNLLAVKATEHNVTSEHLDKMSFYADFPLAGIMRRVFLYQVPSTHIGAYALTTRFDRDYRDAMLSGKVAVFHEGGGSADGRLLIRFTDPDGTPVDVDFDPVSFSLGPWSRQDMDVSLEVLNPRKWDAEHPNLYYISFLLEHGKPSPAKLADPSTKHAGPREDRHARERKASGSGSATGYQTLVRRIGFQQTELKRSEILINGKPVKIIGTCHHDSHPLMGRSVTPELTRQDLTMIKEANLNSIRTSHYPPIPELLDMADEIGLYVEDEGAFCWADTTDDLRCVPRIMQLNAELLARDRHHPSVFMWSICNESNFGFGFEQSYRWVRRSDPARPTGAATGADLEIATLHNPISMKRIQENAALKSPLIFDEAWCIYQGIFGDIGQMWVDPGIRDYYIEPLPPIYDAMMESGTTQGSQIWCWSDDVFCVPNRGIEIGRGTVYWQFINNHYLISGRGMCGDAPWGVVDGWRRPKPEYWHVRKLFSPVRMRNQPVAVDADQRVRIPVTNHFHHTNFSELKIQWRCGEQEGALSVSLEPRSEGEICIVLERRPAPGERLMLRFVDSYGRELDSFSLPLGEEAHDPPVSAAAESPLQIRRGANLGSRFIEIFNEFLDAAFVVKEPGYYDHGWGYMNRFVAFGAPILTELPRIHVLPVRRRKAALPDRLSWKGGAVEARALDGGVVVTVDGTYDFFDGSYTMTFKPDGEVVFRGSFRYTGEEILAREIGIHLSVPRFCDTLLWDRKAEWSLYPPDHIGRPAGTATAFAPHGDAVPPSWPWSLDNTPMGSNDFRSTKRNVYWAALTYPEGPTLLVEGEGRKHIRGIVESDRISLHVLDWYGGTGAELWEWTANYGEGKRIAGGQRVESEVRIRAVPRIGSQPEKK